MLFIYLLYRNALSISCIYGNKEVALILINYFVLFKYFVQQSSNNNINGPKVNFFSYEKFFNNKDLYNLTPLTLACIYNQNEIIHLLVNFPSYCLQNFDRIYTNKDNQNLNNEYFSQLYNQLYSQINISSTNYHVTLNSNNIYSSYDIINYMNPSTKWLPLHYLIYNNNLFGILTILSSEYNDKKFYYQYDLYGFQLFHYILFFANNYIFDVFLNYFLYNRIINLNNPFSFNSYSFSASKNKDKNKISFSLFEIFPSSFVNSSLNMKANNSYSSSLYSSTSYISNISEEIVDYYKNLNKLLDINCSLFNNDLMYYLILTNDLTKIKIFFYYVLKTNKITSLENSSYTDLIKNSFYKYMNKFYLIFFSNKITNVLVNNRKYYKIMKFIFLFIHNINNYEIVDEKFQPIDNKINLKDDEKKKIIEENNQDNMEDVFGENFYKGFDSDSENEIKSFNNFGNLNYFFHYYDKLERYYDWYNESLEHSEKFFNIYEFYSNYHESLSEIEKTKIKWSSLEQYNYFILLLNPERFIDIFIDENKNNLIQTLILNSREERNQIKEYLKYNINTTNNLNSKRKIKLTFNLMTKVFINFNANLLIENKSKYNTLELTTLVGNKDIFFYILKKISFLKFHNEKVLNAYSKINDLSPLLTSNLLLLASISGSLSIIKHLIQKANFDIYILNSTNRRNALSYAIQYGNFKIIRFLIENSLELEKKFFDPHLYDNSQSCSFFSSSSSKTKMYLIPNPLPINYDINLSRHYKFLHEKDSYNKTPIEYSLYYNSYRIISYLLIKNFYYIISTNKLSQFYPSVNSNSSDNPNPPPELKCNKFSFFISNYLTPSTQSYSSHSNECNVDILSNLIFIACKFNSKSFIEFKKKNYNIIRKKYTKENYHNIDSNNLNDYFSQSEDDISSDTEKVILNENKYINKIIKELDEDIEDNKKIILILFHYIYRELIINNTDNKHKNLSKYYEILRKAYTTSLLNCNNNGLVLLLPYLNISNNKKTPNKNDKNNINDSEKSEIMKKLLDNIKIMEKYQDDEIQFDPIIIYSLILLSLCIFFIFFSIYYFYTHTSLRFPYELPFLYFYNIIFTS